MPLFSRPDGVLVRGQSPLRRILPFLMPTRNEAVVYHKSVYDLTRTLPWLERYGRATGVRATLFHLTLFAFAHTLHERPGLNRFVSGGHIYQRKGVQLSFAAKKAFADDAPIVTLKLSFPEGEAFDACVTRIDDAIGGARGGVRTRVDGELGLAFAVPSFVLRAALRFLRWLDTVNLLPASMIAADPAYASMFVANLGSLKLGETYHHLFEYGTGSVFAALGRAEKVVVVGERGEPAVRDGLTVCWSFDERINDGFYCASSLGVAQRIVEDPAAVLGEPG